MSTRSISRRTFLRISTLATVGAVSAACVQTAPAPTSAPAGAAAPVKKAIPASAQGQLPVPRDETLVHSCSRAFVVYDAANPFIPNGIVNDIMVMFWENLFVKNYFAAPGEEDIIPWLAESYKYSEDYKTLSLKLRQGVTWGDGKPFSAADVLFTIQMLLKNDTLIGAAGLIAALDKAESPDANTVVLTFKKPLPRFLNFFVGGLGNIPFPIVPKHIWENQDPMTFKNWPPVLTGPFKLNKTYPDLKMYLWERRDDYWGKALGYFPKMKYTAFREPASAAQELLDLQAGAVDITGSAQTIDWTIYNSAMKSDANLGFSITPDPNPRGFILNDFRAPMDKPEFRWALSYLCNYEKAGTIIWQPPAKQSVGPFAPYPAMDKFKNKDILAKYKLEYNPEKAAAAFEQLGYKLGSDGNRKTPDGKDLTLEAMGYYPVGSPPMEMLNDLAAEAKKIGITINVRRAEQPVIQESVFAGDFDIYVRAIVPGAPDPYNLHYWYAYTRDGQTVAPAGEQASWNWGRLNSPVLDDLVAKLSAISPDAPTAMPLYDAALEEWMKQLPGIPVVDWGSMQCWSNRVWTNWPTEGNFYNSAAYWWGTHLFTFFELEPGAGFSA